MKSGLRVAQRSRNTDRTETWMVRMAPSAPEHAKGEEEGSRDAGRVAGESGDYEEC